jgi:guanosine-diphosphatase
LQQLILFSLGSTQIVFEEPDVERGDHRVELEFSGHTYVLYQHSYDGYGLMQARKSINEASSKSKSGAVCLPQHHQLEFSNDNGDQISLQGAATNFEECQQLISTKVFAKDKVWCAQAPCSFDGVYMPPLGDHHELYAFSYFYDKFSEPFEVGDSFYVGQIKAAAQDVCSNKITEKSLGSEGKKEIKKNREWCSDLGYMYSLLSVGYSLPDTRRVSIAKKVNGIEIGWSLGAAIKMLEKTKKCTLSSRF